MPPVQPTGLLTYRLSNTSQAPRATRSAIPTTGIRAAFPPDTPIAIDAPVWLFALGLSIVSGIAFGLAPAVAATRLMLIEAIKGDSLGLRAGHTQQRFREVTDS